MIKETRTATLNLTSNDENKMILEGYAIVFNEETLIGDAKRGFREMIMPNALTNTSMKDVPLKYNHTDNFLVIARTKNGSQPSYLIHKQIKTSTKWFKMDS